MNSHTAFLRQLLEYEHNVTKQLTKKESKNPRIVDSLKKLNERKFWRTVVGQAYNMLGGGWSV